MLREYDVVSLKRTTPEVPLSVGTTGTILLVYPDDPPAFEVEFIDGGGNSLGTYTVRETDLDLFREDGPTATDRP